MTDTITTPSRKQVAAALHVVAALLIPEEGFHLYDIGDVCGGACTTRQAEVIAAGMTDVTTEEWTGEFGDRYRTYAGDLFGRKIRATHLIKQS